MQRRALAQAKNTAIMTILSPDIAVNEGISFTAKAVASLPKSSDIFPAIKEARTQGTKAM